MKDISFREEQTAIHSEQYAKTISRQRVLEGLSFGLIGLAAVVLLGASLLYGQSGGDTLFIDAMGRVGIGTASPGAQLDVAGDTQMRGSVGINRAPIGNQHLVIQPATGNIPFNVTDPNGAKNWLSVLANGNVVINGGNVGIGTTNPNRLIEINRQGSNTEFSLNERLFLDGGPGTVRITNNAYVQNGSWAIKEKTKKAFTLEIRDSGMLELYGTKTAGQADWQKMATFDAPNNKVDFPSGNVKMNSLQIGNTVIGERELQILKKLVAGKLVVDLFNTKQGEYLYAGDFAPYDKDRRRVFTWRRKTRVNQGYWMLQFPR